MITTNLTQGVTSPLTTTVTGFSPINLAPYSWYTTLDSGSIDQTNMIWKDISGNGRNATVAASTRWPTITNNAINGRQAFFFDGQNATIANRDYLQIDLNGLALSDYTAICVEKRDGTAGFQTGRTRMMISNNNTLPPSNTNRVAMFGYDYLNSTDIMLFGQNNNNYQADIPDFTVPIPRSTFWRFGQVQGKDMYINGVQQTLVAQSGADQYQPLLSCENGQIGRYSNGNYYQGYIGEVIIFNRRITDSEMAALQVYINNVWGM